MSKADEAFKGTLYIVSTPIGNLKDITLRALDILAQADLVAAEDTRHSRKLFTRYGIKTKLVSYFAAKEDKKAALLLDELREGKKVALISDAGTPGISDPGFQLVNKAVRQGHEVVTIPGPSALVSAITISGIPSARFVFEGFLPPKGSERKKRLKALEREERTIVLYESPRRIKRTLEDILACLGDREAALARELTKLHEEVVRGKISDIIRLFEKQTAKGEMALVLSGYNEEPREKAEPQDMNAFMEKIMKKELHLKEAAAIMSEVFTISKREAYEKLLSLKGKGRK
ncbi:MAG: 16S rRNA (cytidine(1402)-2'-O)-methyltransferase [Deltaproteobacteria bacterium]|nr:16S rRNA (cytidine(1402)-2'-O)-methyltransferase [Deltaproteobacteria bacterium]